MFSNSIAGGQHNVWKGTTQIKSQIGLPIGCHLAQLTMFMDKSSRYFQDMPRVPSVWATRRDCRRSCFWHQYNLLQSYSTPRLTRHVPSIHWSSFSREVSPRPNKPTIMKQTELNRYFNPNTNVKSLTGSPLDWSQSFATTNFFQIGLISSATSWIIQLRNNLKTLTARVQNRGTKRCSTENIGSDQCRCCWKLAISHETLPPR